MTRIQRLIEQAQATVKAQAEHDAKVQSVQGEVNTLAKSVDRLVKNLELTPEEKALLGFPENK